MRKDGGGRTVLWDLLDMYFYIRNQHYRDLALLETSFLLFKNHQSYCLKDLILSLASS